MDTGKEMWGTLSQLWFSICDLFNKRARYPRQIFLALQKIKEERWYEEGNCVFFPLKIDRKLGSKFVKDLPEGREFDVVILRDQLFLSSGLALRTFEQVQSDASIRFDVSEPHALLAGVIAELFTTKHLSSMGFDEVIVMHKPLLGDDEDKKGWFSKIIPGEKEELKLVSVPGGKYIPSGDNRRRGFAFVKFQNPES